MRECKWTEEEKEFLREQYNFLSVEEISLKLDRSVKSVYSRANMLGCSCKMRGRKPKLFELLGINERDIL